MSFFKSIFLAFSMFSRLPVPEIEWNEKNMRYMMCGFPFVGAVIGGFFICWVYLMRYLESFVPDYQDFFLNITPLGLLMLPLLITGNIHLDGFMDTSDALGSNADKEKKLSIMKDPHCGAFSVIFCVLYLLSSFVLYKLWFSKIHSGYFYKSVIPLAFSFVLSRILSAFAVAVFPTAKESGLAKTFSDAASKKFTAIWCMFFFVVISVFLVFYGIKAMDLDGKLYGISVILAQVVVFIWYYFMTKKNFGGITGDTAGWFVQMAEIFSLIAVIFVSLFFHP